MTKTEAIKFIEETIASCIRDLSLLIVKGTVNKGTEYDKIRVYTYLTQVDKTIAKAAARIDTIIPKVVTVAYRYGIEKAQNEISKITKYADILHDELHTSTLEYYVRQLDTKYSNVLNAASNTTKRIITKYSNGQLYEAIQKDIIRSFVGTEKINDTLERLNVIVGRETGEQALARDIFASFSSQLPEDYKDIVSGKMINIGGRNYNLAKYSEVIAHITTSEIAIEAEKNTFLENGIELVQVDIHDTKSEVCKPYEGTIWSLTGDSKRHRPISECLNGGPPWHPRCNHYLLPVIDGETIEEVRRYRETKAIKKAKRRLDEYISKYPNGREVTVYLKQDD